MYLVVYHLGNVPYSLTEDYNVADYTPWQKYFGSKLEMEKSEKIEEKSKEDGFLRSVARLANIPFLWTGTFQVYPASIFLIFITYLFFIRSQLFN